MTEHVGKSHKRQYGTTLDPVTFPILRLSAAEQTAQSGRQRSAEIL